MADIFSRLSRFKTFIFKRFKSKIKPIDDKMSSSETTSVLEKERNVESKDNYRRDSFSDSFWDDLCEDILQYLSLEDKLRLECVSKQFQRTVFQRQYKLNLSISREYHKLYLITEHSILRDPNYYNIEYQSLHSFKVLLKKCPNIKQLELNGPNHCDYNYDSIKFNEVFRLIIESCNNLSEVIVKNDIILNESIFEEFHQKFGPKIKYLRSLNELFDLSRFPNIEKIKISGFTLDYISSELRLDKLKQLGLVINQGQEHMLHTVIDTFPTLTHLNLYFRSRDENAIYKSLKSISNLKHLIHFKIKNQMRKIDNRFYDLLKQMANNCQNLKSIDCRFDINDQNSDLRQFLTQLKASPLKRLNLWLNLDQYNIEVNEMFSFELFKGFENITHLSLGFNGLQLTTKDTILKNIDINLPKLQYLDIKNSLYTSQEGVTQMADILSRLSRLQTLKLWFTSEVFEDLEQFEEQIIEKCRKIKEINITL